MKLLTISLIILLAFLQYKLWLEPNGIHEWWRLRQAIQAQTAENAVLEQRNLQLGAEIQDLKQGTDAIQEHARKDLGLVGPGEVFYQVCGK